MACLLVCPLYIDWSDYGTVWQKKDAVWDRSRTGSMMFIRGRARMIGMGEIDHKCVQEVHMYI